MRGPNKPKPLSKPELRALFMVDKYRLLTFEQGIRVGLGKNRHQVRDLFQTLLNAKLIGRTENRDPEMLSILPALHYLKPAGAKALELAFGEPGLASKRRFRTRNEVVHRRGIVDIHIGLQAWVSAAEGWNLETYTTDFEPRSRGRQKATALDAVPGQSLRYPPDATAHLRDANGTLWGILFEFERGGSRGDLSAFRRSKLPLLRELSGGTPRSPDSAPPMGFIEDQLGGLSKAVRFAIVFQDETRRDNALAKWPESSHPDWRRFFIKALPELADDFNAGWWQPDGTRRALFLNA